MKHYNVALVAIVAMTLLAHTALAQRAGPEQGRRPGPPGGPAGQGEARRGRPPVIPLMVALDADKDGELSSKEIANAVAALKKLDKDKDGKLSREELRPRFDGRGGPGEARGPGRGGPEDPRGGSFSPEAFLKRMMSLDRNGDGKITKDEMPERMQAMLKRADANGDGAIDKKEAESIAKRMGQMQRGGPDRGAGREGRGQRPGGDRPGGDRPERSGRPRGPAAA